MFQRYCNILSSCLRGCIIEWEFKNGCWLFPCGNCTSTKLANSLFPHVVPLYPALHAHKNSFNKFWQLPFWQGFESHSSFSINIIIKKMLLNRIVTLIALLAIIDKYGVLITQWTWLYQALSEVSMNKLALWINVCVDDWTAERATIASNASGIYSVNNSILIQ